MRINIRHETTYDYGDPVRSAVQLLRLTPRSFEGQFVRRWRVSLDADARLDRGEDAFGNITHMAFIEGPIQALTIVIEGQVDTIETSGVVRGSVERLNERFFLRSTPLTEATTEIATLARDCMASEGGEALSGLHRISSELSRLMAFEIGTTHSATTAADAFKARRGVCQDFAHVFIAAARSIGIPARYINGYMLRMDMTEQEAGHAWAEAFVRGIGWIAFDPANKVCATESHVRVAVGGDSNEAAPVRGSRIGGRTESLGVAITVSQGRTVETFGMSQTQQQ